MTKAPTSLSRTFSTTHHVGLDVKRRTVLVATAATLAGCATFGPSDGDAPGGEPPLVQAGSADYPHAIRVDNSLDRPVAITLTVEHDESTMYEGRHEMDAGVEAVVAGFTRETFPADRQYVTVTATTADGLAGSVGVSVTDCLGNVVVTFTEDGAPWLTYSIC